MVTLRSNMQGLQWLSRPSGQGDKATLVYRVRRLRRNEAEVIVQKSLESLKGTLPEGKEVEKLPEWVGSSC